MDRKNRTYRIQRHDDESEDDEDEIYYEDEDLEAAEVALAFEIKGKVEEGKVKNGIACISN